MLQEIGESNPLNARSNPAMDLSRISDDVGYEPEYSIDLGIAEYIDWLRNNRWGLWFWLTKDVSDWFPQSAATSNRAKPLRTGLILRDGPRRQWAFTNLENLHR